MPSERSTSRSAQLAADEQAHARAELLDTAARARLLAGEFGAAIELLQASLAIAREHGIDERAAATQLGLADVWATLNLHADAGAGYEAVALWCEANGSAAMGAWATLGWGSALVAQHQVPQGTALLRAALDDFEADGQSSGAISAGLSLAAVTHDPPTRRAILDRVASHGDPEQRPADQAFIELALFDAGAGAQHLEAAQRIVGRMAVPRLRYEVDVRRARTLRAAGDVDRAIVVLRRSVDLINTTAEHWPASVTVARTWSTGSRRTRNWCDSSSSSAVPKICERRSRSPSRHGPGPSSMR